MKPLINIKSFSDIVRLFDFMYKKAIMDCIDVDDVRKCKDFLHDMKSNKAYALLEFEYEMTWREWTRRHQQHHSGYGLHLCTASGRKRRCDCNNSLTASFCSLGTAVSDRQTDGAYFNVP